MCDIARREGTNHSYVARHINLTLLALDIVAAILDETLPEGVQLMSLAINPPMLWEDQKTQHGRVQLMPLDKLAFRQALGSFP